MKKKIKTLRISEDTENFIESIPGKNFANKVYNMIRLFREMIEDPVNEDLEAMAYEKFAKAYLAKFHPMLNEEVERRREELNQYQDLLTKLDNLNTFFQELQDTFEKLNQQTVMFMSKNFEQEEDQEESE